MFLSFSYIIFFSKESFNNTNRVQNSLDPDETVCRLSLTWVQIVCKDYQQINQSGDYLVNDVKSHAPKNTGNRKQLKALGSAQAFSLIIGP